VGHSERSAAGASAGAGCDECRRTRLVLGHRGGDAKDDAAGIIGVHSPATLEGVGFAEIRAVLADNGWIYNGVVVWNKTNSIMSNQATVCNSSEFVWLYRRGESRVQPLGAYHNVVTAPIQKKPDHPFQKPIAFCERVIEATVPENHVVVDPFAGSGTYGVAAVRLGRLYFGAEVVRTYADIANQRILEQLRLRRKDAS